MSTMVLCGSLATLACDGSGPAARPVDEGVSDGHPDTSIHSDVDCARFVGVEPFEAYCAYLSALDLSKPKDAIAACQRAGDWELPCRGEWVSVWARGDRNLRTEDLLEVCGENADCAFGLIETRPSGDVLADIERCGRHTGAFSHDCVKHMLNLWLNEGPDAEESARVASANTAYSPEVGRAIAYLVACTGTGTCDGAPEVTARCRRACEDFERRPGDCQRGAVSGPWATGGGAPGQPAPAAP